MKHNYLKNLYPLVLFLTFFSSYSQEYTVQSIPYSHHNFENVGVGLSIEDDRYSQVVDLKGANPLAPAFNFTFYGNTYDKIVVSSNGYIDFRTSLANTASAFRFMNPIPNIDFPTRNSILGCYHDMNPSYFTVNDPLIINYVVRGIAPARRFILSFANVPLYGMGCSSIKSYFQVVLYEGSNNIEVFVKNKPGCDSTLNKLSVIGLINEDGTRAISPPGRNVGEWTTQNEGWRFSQVHPATTPYRYVKCYDVPFQSSQFSLNFLRQELAEPNMVFFRNRSEANSNDYFIPGDVYNSEGLIYGRKASGALVEIRLMGIHCGEDTEYESGDFDSDGIPNELEDVNGDGNLANDDTDGDGIPNYRDSDDDGDSVPTSVEILDLSGRFSIALDTDGDGIPNYLDNDDDGDGVLTINEDYNHNGDPTDDDINNNGIPDYLDQAVALGLKNNDFAKFVKVYPNPATTVLKIENKSTEEIKSISIHSITGALVKQSNNGQMQSISVSDLESGIYFIKIQIGDYIVNHKFSKK